jgi:hypothetical protein
MKRSLPNKFWKRYISADYLERRSLALQLTGIDNSNISLMQSYFDDLIDVMEKKI